MYFPGYKNTDKAEHNQRESELLGIGVKKTNCNQTQAGIFINYSCQKPFPKVCKRFLVLWFSFVFTEAWFILARPHSTSFIPTRTRGQDVNHECQDAAETMKAKYLRFDQAESRRHVCPFVYGMDPVDSVPQLRNVVSARRVVVVFFCRQYRTQLSHTPITRVLTCYLSAGIRNCSSQSHSTQATIPPTFSIVFENRVFNKALLISHFWKIALHLFIDYVWSFWLSLDEISAKSQCCLCRRA